MFGFGTGAKIAALSESLIADFTRLSGKFDGLDSAQAVMDRAKQLSDAGEIRNVIEEHRSVWFVATLAERPFLCSISASESFLPVDAIYAAGRDDLHGFALNGSASYRVAFFEPPLAVPPGANAKRVFKHMVRAGLADSIEPLSFRR